MRIEAGRGMALMGIESARALASPTVTGAKLDMLLGNANVNYGTNLRFKEKKEVPRG